MAAAAASGVLRGANYIEGGAYTVGPTTGGSQVCVANVLPACCWCVAGVLLAAPRYVLPVCCQRVAGVLLAAPSMRC